ncbi:hypothetical protein [Sorangium sp. So ce363]|uniref:hypothetical protein n=1 Tax=Sorangium sp. So ce363 TaxID=3133304 RepID=UPI003F5F99E9
MASEVGGYLIRQFEIAWQLTSFHLDGLSTEECLWRPADQGLHVTKAAQLGGELSRPFRELLGRRA